MFEEESDYDAGVLNSLPILPPVPMNFPESIGTKFVTLYERLKSIQRDLVT